MSNEHDSVITADSIRARGWAVTLHNDYQLRGKTHTFWLFTKGGRCAKGEGLTDDEALRVVAAEIDRTEQDLGSKIVPLKPAPEAPPRQPLTADWKLRPATEERRRVLEAFDHQNPELVGQHCHAGSDGECCWDRCPQIRDNEPLATERHCPLDRYDDEEY